MRTLNLVYEALLELLRDVVFVQLEPDEDNLALAVAAVLVPLRVAPLAGYLLVHTLRRTHNVYAPTRIHDIHE